MAVTIQSIHWLYYIPFNCSVLACTHLLYTTVQIDSPAQLANVLVNITTSDEIESEDVSLTVGLLDTVTNSTEDLQQEDVSCSCNAWLCAFMPLCTNDATGCINSAVLHNRFKWMSFQL